MPRAVRVDIFPIRPRWRYLASRPSPNCDLAMPSARAGARVLGVDVGAVSVSAVEFGSDGEVLGVHYELHHGDVEAALTSVLRRVGPGSLAFVAFTTSAPALLRAA